MAYPFAAVCFLVFILDLATCSQDSSLTKPADPSHLRRHRHDRHHHSETLRRTAADEVESHGSDKEADEDYGVDQGQGRGTAMVETGENEDIMIGRNKAINEGLPDNWRMPPAFPLKMAEYTPLVHKHSSGGLLNHKNQNPSQSSYRHDDLPDELVSHAHYPYRTEHHSDQQERGIQDQDSDLETETQPLNSSKVTDEFNRTDPQDMKLRNGLSRTSMNRQSPVFSKLYRSITTVGNSSKTTMKERQNFRRKISRRRQVNRPRWYFEANKQEGAEEEKRAKSGWSEQPHNRPEWSKPSEKSGSKEHSDDTIDFFTEYANPSDIDNYQNKNNTGHTELKALHMEHDTDMEKKDDRKREVPRKPASGKRRRKKYTQRKRPLVKECVGCTKMEAEIAEARELHKQVLKAQLLDKLRLVPTLTERPLPPKLPETVFPDLPQQDYAGHEDQYYARPTHLLVFGRDLGKHRLRKPRTGSYEFEVRGKVKGDVTKADLWVYKMQDARDSQGQTLVVTHLHYTKGRRLCEHSLVARLDTHVQEGWVRFDVTRLVRRWLESDMSSAPSQMLAIRCKTCYRTSYRAIFGVKSNFRPVLVIKERRHPPQDSPRSKRSSQCDPNSRCCKFDLTVRFHDLGIHEIFYPKSIHTGYCYGTCERPDLHYHNHTMIIQRLRFGSYQPVDDDLRERLRPCCVPVVLREASIMHYINGGQDTQVSLIPNLLVDKCGCA